MSRTLRSLKQKARLRKESGLCSNVIMIIPHFNRRSDAVQSIEAAIIVKLNSGPCHFDEIVTGLPTFSWRELFVAVDCMLRDGRVFLRKLAFSTYQISLGSRHTECRALEGDVWI